MEKAKNRKKVIVMSIIAIVILTAILLVVFNIPFNKRYSDAVMSYEELYEDVKGSDIILPNEDALPGGELGMYVYNYSGKLLSNIDDYKIDKMVKNEKGGKSSVFFMTCGLIPNFDKYNNEEIKEIYGTSKADLENYYDSFETNTEILGHPVYEDENFMEISSNDEDESFTEITFIHENVWYFMSAKTDNNDFGREELINLAEDIIEQF